MAEVDTLIIGAGVVGLAAAWKIAEQTGQTIAVLERCRKYGQEISSRNSEVIHSGIYYNPEMLKSRLCVKGNRMLYEFCADRKVTHAKCGKILIALDQEEAAQLDSLYDNARLNQAAVCRLTAQQVKDMEPGVAGCAGLYFPDSGTVDVHEYMQALYYEGRQAGVIYLFGSAVRGASFYGDHYAIDTGQEIIRTKKVVNCAGMEAVNVAGFIGIDTKSNGYTLYPCKGEYFKIRRRLPIKHLIYSAPTPYSLGIHLSMDSSGSMRLGPNAFYVDELDYSVDESHAAEFYEAAKGYIPSLKLEDLMPDFAGIRPKIQGPGEAMKDFIIKEESAQGFPGWLNLIGIESPGLTASLAIGEYVADLLR